MAKSSRNRQRDIVTPTPIATRGRVLPGPVSLRVGISPARQTYIPIDPLDDGRRWSPIFQPAPRRFTGPSGKLLQPRPTRRGYQARHSRTLPAQLLFQAPSKLALCVRRHVRKQVLFAKGWGGSRAPRRNHRNFYSAIGC